MNKFKLNTLKSLVIATTLTTGLFSSQMNVQAAEGDSSNTIVLSEELMNEIKAIDFGTYTKLINLPQAELDLVVANLNTSSLELGLLIDEGILTENSVSAIKDLNAVLLVQDSEEAVESDDVEVVENTIVEETEEVVVEEVVVEDEDVIVEETVTPIVEEKEDVVVEETVTPIVEEKEVVVVEEAVTPIVEEKEVVVVEETVTPIVEAEAVIVEAEKVVAPIVESEKEEVVVAPVQEVKTPTVATSTAKATTTTKVASSSVQAVKAPVVATAKATAKVATPVVKATVKVVASKIDVSTPAKFISTISDYAKKVAGGNDLLASVMVAQAALESGYGQSSLSQAPNYNLFGIKGSYNGEYAYMNTKEDDGKGNMYTIKTNFKKYPSYLESLQDYAKLIKNGTNWNKNIYSGVWASNTDSYKDATKALTGVYATDTAYNTKLNSIIENYKLYLLDDMGIAPSDVDKIIDNSTVLPTTSASNAKYHIVVSGDTLSKIANDYKTTVTKLVALNNIKDKNNINIGQKIQLKDIIVVSTPVTKPVVSTPVVAKPVVTSSTSTNITKYKVVSGDYLGKIASKYNTSVANLKSLNNLKSDLIYVGQSLIVSKTASVSTPVKETAKPTTSTSSTATSTNKVNYKVVSGDYLGKIATKYNTTVAKLMSLNNLKSTVIQVGQTLVVSGSNTSTTPVKTTTSTSNKVSTSTTNTTSTVKYKVVSGDYLGKIATKYNTTVAKLMSLNNLKSTVIQVGQTLLVSESKTTVASSTSTSTSSNASKTITVKSGDTLWGLANSNKTSVSKIKSLNNLKSDVIQVGQKLVIK